MSEAEINREWLAPSIAQYNGACYLFNTNDEMQYSLFIYFIQQSSEKSLKGFLHFNQIEPPRNDNLVSLCHMCMNIDNSFNALLSQCTQLNDYITDTRYPSDLVLAIEDAKEAIVFAYSINSFIFEKIDISLISKMNNSFLQSK
jgi:HEPN domain-containing protein